MTTSLAQPLTPVKNLTTKSQVHKILRVRNELLLGQSGGWLQLFDIETSAITSTHKFKEGLRIRDMIAIDDSHYLLAADQGLLETTKDQVIKHYHKGKCVRSLCHITESIYLLGLNDDGLIVWDEKKG